MLPEKLTVSFPLEWVEMTFEKTEKVKKAILDWEDVPIKETKKFYKVKVHDGSMFECYFKTFQEYVTTRYFNKK